MPRKPRSRSAAHAYRPTMDWWVAAFLGLTAAILVVSVPLLMWQPLTSSSKAIGFLGILILILYLVDIAVFTQYVLTAEGLVVCSQMRHFLFPYRAMRQIRPAGAGSLFSFFGTRRFSLSANSLSIDLAEGDYRRISLSPANRQDFIEDLLRHIDHEREQHSTLTRPR